MTCSETHNFNPGILKIAKSIQGSNIAFVIDTSNSMHSNLELIKAFTIELIDIFMCQIDSYSFNVISFSDSYSKLSNVLLPCCKSTAVLASEWIQTLNCDTSKNTLLALGTAFTDSDVDAVIMLTDGLLTQKSTEVVKCVAELSQGRPLHVVHINEENEETDVLKFLESLAMCTNGTFHMIKHVSKCVLREEQIYPFEEASSSISCGSSSSAHSSSEEEEEEEKEDKCEDQEAGETKLLGKFVLAKRNSNGYYYKGTIIKTTSSSEDVVVLFDRSKDKSAQLQQICLINELIFYDNAKEEKIYADDKVLVNLDGKKRFIPATVLKKEYIFDDAVKDDVHFTKVLEVELVNGNVEKIPISSAVHIALDCYDRIVGGINVKPSKKTGASEENEEETKDTEAEGTEEDIEKALLRDKIERQLRESEEFLKSLNTKANEERQLRESEEFLKSLNTKANEGKLWNGIVKYNHCNSSLNSSSDIIISRKKPATKLYSHSFTDGDESEIAPTAYPQPKHTPSLPSTQNTERKCRFTESMLPPVSWNNPTKLKRDSCANPRRMKRAKSVGCNVVELSKKHWKGRPTTRESTPKRPFNECTIIRPKMGGPPKAEEYQTADGVPFPRKTDNRFRRTKSSNWTPDAQEVSEYLHHDIIGHRIVNIHKPTEIMDTCEDKEEERKKKSITARRVKQRLRKEKAVQENEVLKSQLEERDEQVRKQIEDRVKDEFSKIRITVEKDNAMQKQKQQKQIKHREFEREREKKNQERKHTRIESLRERRKNYKNVEDERNEGPIMRDQHVQTYRRTRNEKQSEFEKSRIEQQIEDHESKLNRLKELRRLTEARFRTMRKDNDTNRDMDSHVKDQQLGITRSGILP